jgi:hypothetical protein
MKKLGNCDTNNRNNCTKGGVKIHETYTNTSNTNNKINASLDPEEFYNKIKGQNKHTGVRITQGENEYNIDPFDNINPFSNPDGIKDFKNVTYDNSSYSQMDLNIDNYSINDIYNLFGVQNKILTDEVMRESKKIVLKTHPDKSRLEPKYFLFFSKAYKRLFGIYEFQNKTTKKVEDKNEFYDSSKGEILNKMFEKEKGLKNSGNFNKWFNEQFDKHKLEDNLENGYGDWLKSNEDIVDVGNVSQANMAAEMEKRKKQVQTMTTYNGVNDPYASSFGGSTLMEHNKNFSSGTLFSNDGMGYTDLRQAYVESVIPVTQEDYQKMPKFRNIEEYKMHRNTVDVTPIDKTASMRQLYNQNKDLESESAALAFHYAKQSEKAKKSSESFWSGLKQITYS